MTKFHKHICLFFIFSYFHSFAIGIDTTITNTANTLNIRVIDTETKEDLPNTLVILIDLTNNKKDTITLNSDNEFNAKINSNTEYALKCSSKTTDDNEIYLTVSKTFKTTDKIDSISTIIELEKVVNQTCGGNFANDLNFDFEDPSLTEVIKKELTGLSDIMKKYPAMVIEITTHNDCRERNQNKLSTQRLKNIMKYLFKQGIEQNRLQGISFNSSRPTNRCDCSIECTEEEYEANRRVKFSIIKFD